MSNIFIPERKRFSFQLIWISGFIFVTYAGYYGAVISISGSRVTPGQHEEGCR